MGTWKRQWRRSIQDIEWHATVGGIDEGRVYRGHAKVIEGFADYFGVWERLEMSVERYIDAGGDDVIVFHHEVAKGRASGVVVGDRYGHRSDRSRGQDRPCSLSCIGPTAGARLSWV